MFSFIIIFCCADESALECKIKRCKAVCQIDLYFGIASISNEAWIFHINIQKITSSGKLLNTV